MLVLTIVRSQLLIGFQDTGKRTQLRASAFLLDLLLFCQANKFIQFDKNNAKTAKLLHSSVSFKVTTFGTNGKLVLDFLLLNNGILSRTYQDIADYWQRFCC